MAGALEGIVVLDLTRHAAGAIATMFLGDHGARVVRLIDSVADLHRSGGFIVWDRGKEVVLADLSDGPALAEMAARADVVIEDFSPSERPAELSPEALVNLAPQLTPCSITAYGEYGSVKDEPPVDDLVLARTGVLSGLPGFRGAPVHTAHPLPSTAAGILAALGIVAALFERETTGRGRPIATSLVAGALLYHPKVESERLARHVFQTNPYGSAPFYSVYECADGEWLQLGCVHPGFIARAADLFGIGDVIQDPVYGRGHSPKTPGADAHLRSLVRECMLTRASADWMADFDAGDIPFARAQTTRDALDDVQVGHNGMVVRLDDPAVGPVEQMGVPVKLSVTPGAAEQPRAGVPLGRDEIAPVRVVATGEGKEAGWSGARDRRLLHSLPLTGVRVLEITNLIAGPMAGRLLADIGADVIKLEPPGGDISRPIGRTYFYSVNFDKRSIAVDTAQAAGKEVVRRIAATSDVVLANLRPGATRRMGIGVEADPNVIETQISGYGLTGPYAHRPGIDPLAQALMGLERAQGGEGNPPSFPAQLAPTDFTTGAMAAFGTVLALYAKKRGIAAGQRVEVNLLDGGIMLSSEWFTRYAGRPERPLADREQWGVSPYHRIYAVADGFVYVAAETEDARARLVESVCPVALGPCHDPVQIDNQHPNATPFAKRLAAAFSALPVEEAIRRMKAAGVACSPVRAAEAEGFFSDADTRANGWAVTRDHATAGRLTAVARYMKFDGSTATDAIRQTPLLGEQHVAILDEAGYSPGEISALQRDRLVVSE